MKTLRLKLKKKVLIIDAENCGYISDTSLVVLGGTIYNIPEDYEFLCKGSGLTEEMANELVDHWQNMANDGFIFENYKDNIPKKLTAKKSFISAVESKGFYWLENPISLDRAKLYERIGDTSRYNGIKKVWQEAEEKTFKNPLIFVKK